MATQARGMLRSQVSIPWRVYGGGNTPTQRQRKYNSMHASGNASKYLRVAQPPMQHRTLRAPSGTPACAQLCPLHCTRFVYARSMLWQLLAKGHVVNCAPFATSRNTCAYNGRPNVRCACALSSRVHVYACRVARACEVSSYACGMFAKSASARNTPVAANESGCACVRMRLQFACAFVRMHSHVSMLQPSSSGVMHAKPRGVHGTGQARQ